VATRARELANQQLAQSRDRLPRRGQQHRSRPGAGGRGGGHEQYISALYGFSVAKGVLAQSLGTAEEAVAKYSEAETDEDAIQISSRSWPWPSCDGAWLWARGRETTTMRRWMRM